MSRSNTLPQGPSRGAPSFGSDTPKGFQAIYESCRRIYPDQPNPLQVIAVVKFWNDGPDPLDYISMYSNAGNPRLGIVSHWHYVSFGLSDLHGDGRVHENMGPDGKSGFGFELTFRLKREAGETAPPTWPAALLQALARYVFNSGNMLYSGDHIPWHTPLDGSESRIQHMLITDDPQFEAITTPHGSLTFLQVVGVCEEELKAAQHWNGPGVLDFIKSVPSAGGEWLITDMRRGETIFDLDHQLQDRLDNAMLNEGSNLSGVSGMCYWEVEPEDDEQRSAANENRDMTGLRNIVKYEEEEDGDRRHLSSYESSQIRDALTRGLGNTGKLTLPPIKTENQRKPPLEEEPGEGLESSGSLLASRHFKSVHIKFNLDTATVLPLALGGRLKHGRHFTFKNSMNDSAVTLVPCSVSGSLVTEIKPYAAHDLWLQVLLTDDLIDEMMKSLAELNEIKTVRTVKTYRWSSRGLTISILPEPME